MNSNLGAVTRTENFPNKWRTINSWVHKIRLHGRRVEGTAESFSRLKLRQAPQKEGGEILCDLPSFCVTPAGASTGLTSRINEMTTHARKSARNRKIAVDAVREAGETWVESEKNVEKKGLVQ